MFTKVEEPDYTVPECLENNVEIKECRPQIWAAIVKGSENRAFGTLAGYIFDDNSLKERIGMTAPVVTDEGRMAFVMRYNPLRTHPFMRRNEVALMVNR
ncbi:MAG: heme-binding protein [Methanothrix sp.]|nr:heme-binding protein [Methanothrix sp.]